MFDGLHQLPLGARHQRATVRVVFSATDVSPRPTAGDSTSERDARSGGCGWSALFRFLPTSASFRSSHQPRARYDAGRVFLRRGRRVPLTAGDYSVSAYTGANWLRVIVPLFGNDTLQEAGRPTGRSGRDYRGDNYGQLP